MVMPDIPPELVKVVPGTVGSLVSMLFIKDTWPRKVAMFVAGAGLARYGSEPLSGFTHLSEGFAGFLLGLFGMAVVAKVFDTWDHFDVGTILVEWVRKVLGLPAKGA